MASRGRFGPDSAGLQEKVKGITSLPELDRITDGIYAADTLDAARAVVLRLNWSKGGVFGG